MLSVYVDESMEQTKAILTKAAKREANPKVKEDSKDKLQEFVMFQQWLSYGCFSVVILFMPYIIEGIKRMTIRFRRDVNNTLTSLIKTSAIVHQVNREINEQGYIVATLDDYENVRDLINPAMSRDASVDLSPTEGKLLKWIYDGISDDVKNGDDAFEVSSRNIEAETGIAQSTVSSNIKYLLDKKYLVNVQETKGRPMQLKLGDNFSVELIDEGSSLPTRQWLDEHISKMNKKNSL